VPNPRIIAIEIRAPEAASFPCPICRFMGGLKIPAILARRVRRVKGSFSTRRND
jgi:hypothetical protein